MEGRGALALAFALPFLAACGSGASLDVSPAPTTGKAGRCATCHMADFQSAPEHVGEKPTTCAVCHAQERWHSSRIDHAWPLTGAHAKAASCFECHKGEPPVFEGTKSACVDCHRADYEKAPEHVARQFPTTCQECHGTAAWKPLLPGAAASSAPEATPSASAEPPPSPPSANPSSTAKPPAHPAPSRPPAPSSSRTPHPPPDVTTHASPRVR
jgi:hypothetical protein